MKTIANGARLPLLHPPLVQACQTKPFPNKDVKEREPLLLCPDGNNSERPVDALAVEKH